MEALWESEEQGFEFEVEMVAACIQHHFDLEWVPIRTIYSGENSHIHPLAHMVNYFRIVWMTRKRMRQPVKDVNLSAVR